MLSAYLEEFLPNPSIVIATIQGKIRRLINCDYIETPEHLNIPNYKNFRSHLDSLKTLEDKIKFLRNLRRFIDQCKRCFNETEFLPDLVGRGNVVCKGTNIFLLDSNNAAFAPCEGADRIIIPLDNRGFPIFDMSLRLLYRLERHLLVEDKGNISSQGFTKQYRKARNYHDEICPEELADILTSKKELKGDHFYGAVRFKARRELVDDIVEKLSEISHF